MNLAAWIGVTVAIVGWIYVILRLTFQAGTKVGEYEKFKEDVQELHEAISTNNDMQNERFKEFYDDYQRFRRRIAKEIGINGSD